MKALNKVNIYKILYKNIIIFISAMKCSVEGLIPSDLWEVIAIRTHKESKGSVVTF